LLPVVKALVTGGAGFIGSHLVTRLVRDGHEVRVLDNFSTGNRSNLAEAADSVELVEGDIQSYERVHNAVRGCHVIAHLAALPSVPRSVQDPLTSNATNVTGTLNVLLAARDSDVGRLVYASSSSVYGANPDMPKREEQPTLPISPYAVAKLAGESYCRAFHEVFGLETVSLRFFNVFGPGQDPLSQYAAVIPRFITSLLDGKPPVVYGDGEQSRDFTYVDNVLDGVSLALSTPGNGGKAFNLATGHGVTLNELVRMLKEIIGSDVDPVYEQGRPGEVRHSQADVTRAREALGFEPAISIEEGLARTVEFFRERAAVAAE
jgi:UDP-N-acetylglucosamine/UDP-N-acetyl-alpha-D-glucosaminouronate 4-epimerase